MTWRRSSSEIILGRPRLPDDRDWPRFVTLSICSFDLLLSLRLNRYLAVPYTCLRLPPGKCHRTHFARLGTCVGTFPRRLWAKGDDPMSQIETRAGKRTVQIEY